VLDEGPVPLRENRIALLLTRAAARANFSTKLATYVAHLPLSSRDGRL
jgi:hypothetical protein